MRALVQRVEQASVTVGTEIVGAIEAGLCVLVGVTHDDGPDQANRLVEKLAGLRIFDDPQGVMNLSVADTQGAVLVISQFTLYGDVQKGKRPSWMAAARPDQAEPLIEQVVEGLTQRGIMVETGRFRADMKVKILNDGPVTLMVEV
ncbi:MAG: D-tyrosyl-tRNA(Tyr) deacylase [Actinobacteria bacterium]|jgi:D-tyrosyl-tRNA(Tyr) deacylase|nr:D-tyrosyl-tRNA(Tyr) deacylase [Actinomycetota bacterium]MDE0927460.1 D-aminoacyl-tRNA deacylase [Acidimicrobiales bacterium]MBT3747042.1 D-tyrosyl-tRNA(Tyr) deacylase [Actinomycetota bacterium]MBT3968950.1 D-tyrosyl-tRNA(Tyr) deacylase [Actinomycetota bacterium]MBT4009591.1 D-tyrosyl-tRNA(Tyr) deacylase [Actinomycetota bacterium]